MHMSTYMFIKIRKKLMSMNMRYIYCQGNKNMLFKIKDSGCLL